MAWKLIPASVCAQPVGGMMGTCGLGAQPCYHAIQEGAGGSHGEGTEAAAAINAVQPKTLLLHTAHRMQDQHSVVLSYGT